MVMERPLSPQSVGREFVRQYYTLLNEAPAHLHRFYNNSSSFIHGGLDAPNRETVAVVGQKQIHQRIQQLNFRDCHAKISQVDSQATLGNGVVVQVTGELSNAGQRMRRFTQTFVLAAQSPKKYYVHNDIFRYQDTDEDMEEELSRSEAGENQENDIEQNDIHTVQQQSGGYYGDQVVNGTSEVQPPQDDPAGPALCEPPVQSQPTHYQEEYDNIPQQPPQVQPIPAPVQEMVPPLQQQTQGGSYVVVELQNNQPEETEYHHCSPPIQPTIPPQIVQPHIMPSEPKTYATLVKSGSQIGGPVYYNTSPTNHTQQHIHHHSEDMSPPPQIKSENKGFDMRPNHNTPKPQRSEPIRNNYNSTPRHQPSDEHNGNSFGGDGDRRRLQYSDNHQVFVGNIPRNVTESGLRDVFAQFGSIVGLKIFPKNTSKSTGQLKVPYYGFVTFEEISSVQAVLNTTKPIMYPDENGVKLNVEEKKARRGEGGGGGGGRIGGRGGPGGPMMRGGGGTPPRGGGGRGGGGVRFNTPVPTRR